MYICRMDYLDQIQDIYEGDQKVKIDLGHSLFYV